MRDLSANVITELEATSCKPILLAELSFKSATLYLWNGVGDLSWDSKTWIGNGLFHGFEGALETDDLSGSNIDIVLPGSSPETMSLVLGEVSQGATGKLWLGMLDSSGAVVADPYMFFTGTLDVPEIQEAGDNCTIRLAYDSKLIALEKAKEYRWNKETQQIFFPGDLGFDYVVAAHEWDGFWGAKKKKPQKEQRKTKKGRRVSPGVYR